MKWFHGMVSFVAGAVLMLVMLATAQHLGFFKTSVRIVDGIAATTPRMSKEEFIRANDLLEDHFLGKGGTAQIVPMGDSYQMIVHANDGGMTGDDMGKIQREATERVMKFIAEEQGK